MKRQKLYRWFFICAIIYAAYKAVMSFFLVIPIVGQILSFFLFPIPLAWLAFSIAILVLFIKDKFPKVYLVLPIYYITGFVLSFMFGVIYGMVIGIFTMGMIDPFTGIFIIITTCILAIFEIIYAALILTKTIGQVKLEY